MENKVVQNISKAYGYNYASLADIARQGFKIPIMSTRLIEGKLFIFWLSGAGEWQQGAEVIVPEMKGMNKAQMMGSALTYARRYTAQMALGLACDDDADIESRKHEPDQRQEQPKAQAPKNNDASVKIFDSLLSEYEKLTDDGWGNKDTLDKMIAYRSSSTFSAAKSIDRIKALIDETKAKKDAQSDFFEKKGKSIVQAAQENMSNDPDKFLDDSGELYK